MNEQIIFNMNFLGLINTVGHVYVRTVFHNTNT